MIDVGIAGSLGTALGWMCALLFLAMSTVSGRVAWAIAVRGARNGLVRVVLGCSTLLLALGLGVGHFVDTPQTLEIERDGTWVLTDAYGMVTDRVPAEEVRQVRLTSPVGSGFRRVEVRRADGSSLILYGNTLLDELGYAFNSCGAWQDRPVWGPHDYDDLGPRCDDAPWPALTHRGADPTTVARYTVPDAP